VFVYWSDIIFRAAFPSSPGGLVAMTPLCSNGPPHCRCDFPPNQCFVSRVASCLLPPRLFPTATFFGIRPQEDSTKTCANTLHLKFPSLPATAARPRHRGAKQEPSPARNTIVPTCTLFLLRPGATYFSPFQAHTLTPPHGLLAILIFFRPVSSEPLVSSCHAPDIPKTLR